jgi:hypothetical protein
VTIANILEILTESRNWNYCAGDTYNSGEQELKSLDDKLYKKKTF